MAITQAEDMEAMMVLEVIDGDTVNIDLQGFTEPVLYVGIDTPETHHPTRGLEIGGIHATERKELVEGQTLYLEPEVSNRDEYGRLLRYGLPWTAVSWSDGHQCYSLPEKMIDDWLSANRISHEKEPRYPYHYPLNPTGMRADWLANGTFIEYAGMMDEPDYAFKMKTKIRLASEQALNLIILEPEDVLSLEKKLRPLIPASS